MTDVRVVDASALAALLFGEPEAEAVAQRLTGARLTAPTLLAYELAVVCLAKAQRHPGQRNAIKEAFHLALRMPIETVAVDHAKALRLAEETGLTVCDASYLWLSRALGCELITLDSRLAEAAA